MRTHHRRAVFGLALIFALVAALGACSEGQQQQLQEQAKEGAEQAKQVAGDAALTGAVKTKLVADATAKAAAINVDTTNGVVTLSGTVESEAARASAEAIAKQTDGVTSVVNNLTVGAPAVKAGGAANANSSR
jgi:osmotically-inducible protein OsmY